MKTIWFNMRQEPVVYVNGLPNTLRDPDRCRAADSWSRADVVTA